MISIFRIVSYLEGISYILLLGVGVPLKYMFENDSWVKALGMPHGLLFVAYIVLAYVVKTDRDWSNRTFIHACLAAIIPFGTFVFDRRMFGNKSKA